jgi:hypothetical protein
VEALVLMWRQGAPEVMRRQSEAAPQGYDEPHRATRPPAAGSDTR